MALLSERLKAVFQRTGSKDDCGYHDWEVREYRGGPRDLRITYGYGTYTVKEKKTFDCRHEGCEATKKEWVTVDRDDAEKVMDTELREFIE